MKLYIKYYLIIVIINSSLHYKVSAQEKLYDSSLYFIRRGINYYYNKDFTKSEIDLTKALDIRKHIYPEYSKYLGYSYNNLGLLYLNTWDFNKSIEYLNIAKRIFTYNNMPIDNSVTLSNLGVCYKSMGNFNLAEQFYFQALDLLKGISTLEVNERKAGILNRLGILETHRHNYRLANMYFKTAIEKYKNHISDKILHNLYDNLANNYLLLKDLDSTSTVLNKALKLSLQSQELSEIFTAKTLKIFSKYFISVKEKEMAYNSLVEYKAIFKRNSVDSINFFTLLLDFADYHTSFSEYDLALFQYQKALQFLTKQNISNNHHSPSSEKYINPILGIEVLRKKADLLIKLYIHKKKPLYLEEAIKSMLVASELVDQSRNSFLSVESKLALTENESAIYQIGIYASSQLFYLTNDQKYLLQAFQFSEKSKSSVLEGTLQEQKAKTFGGIPDSLLKHEIEYKRNIAFYKELLYYEQSKAIPDSNRLRNFQTIIFDFTEKHENLKNQFEDLYPNYYELKYKSDQISIKNLQQIINRNTTVLEYTLTDSLLYVFQIDNKNAELFIHKICQHDIDILSDFLQVYKTFHYLKQGTGIFSAYEKKAFSIYEKLIGSANPKVINKNLIIIPDNILSYIPFEALAKTKNKYTPTSYLDIDYLNNHYSIFYSYSANLLVETSNNNKPKLLNRALAIAPEYGKPDIAIFPRNEPFFANLRSSLKHLPFAREEAELVSRITGGFNLLGDEATEEKFILASPNYQILHLAMHTLIDDKNPLFSKLVFSNDSLESGFLTTNEVFSLKLNARMTVLSACSSGEGKLKKGEGVLSLARSFFYAGCPSLVMTLWNVDDNAGLSLMNYYYKYLKKGLSKPKALQLAKKNYLSDVPPEKQHPFYWANYICIGNPSPLFISKGYIIILVFLISLTVFTVIKVIRWKEKPTPLPEPSPDSSDQI